MKISRSTRIAARYTAVIFAVLMGNLVLAAEGDGKVDVDVVPPEQQSDERISVWVDDASLSLFVSQLATITGRDAQVEGEMAATVSGTFNGSVLEALTEVREQTPVIFDMDETSLAVAPESARSSATVVLGTSASDDQLLKTLMTDMPPGNDILVRDGEALISGHPLFVQRTAKTMTVAYAKTAVTEPVVVSAAAQVITNEDIAEPDTAVQTEALPTQTVQTETAPAETASEPRPIRWVTDIPGFDTF